MDPTRDKLTRLPPLQQSSTSGKPHQPGLSHQGGSGMPGRTSRAMSRSLTRRLVHSPVESDDTNDWTTSSSSVSLESLPQDDPVEGFINIGTRARHPTKTVGGNQVCHRLECTTQEKPHYLNDELAIADHSNAHRAIFNRLVEDGVLLGIRHDMLNAPIPGTIFIQRRRQDVLSMDQSGQRCAGSAFMSKVSQQASERMMMGRPAAENRPQHIVCSPDRESDRHSSCSSDNTRKPRETMRGGKYKSTQCLPKRVRPRTPIPRMSQDAVSPRCGSISENKRKIRANTESPENLVQTKRTRRNKTYKKNLASRSPTPAP